MTAPPAPITLVKLGGSLLTDKTRPRSLRHRTLARLARELASATSAGVRVVVGHGSGSFGHQAAHEVGYPASTGAARVQAAAHVQLAAGELHRRLLAVFAAHGVAIWTMRPAAWLTLDGEATASTDIAALLGALDAGAVPLVCGDVVADRQQGSAIASTERVFEVLLAALAAAGRPVAEVLWVGATPGILDGRGRLVPVLDAARRAELDRELVGAAGVDVTGGVRLRADTALRLANLGVPSRILDGRRPGRLAAALRGEVVPATLVPTAGRLATGSD